MGKKGLEKRAERLALLLEITRVINSGLEVEDIFRLLAVGIRRLFAFDRLDLALLDNLGELTLFASGGEAGREKGSVGSLCWRVMEAGRPQLFKDLSREEPSLGLPEGMRSGMAVPLQTSEGAIGVLSLWSGERGAFSHADLEVWQPLAAQLTVALEKARSYAALKDLLLQAIAALAEAIEAKFPHAKGHSRRVTEGAVAIGREMGLPQDRLEGLYLAGLLHDIGKVGVLASILNKPAKLTSAEYSLVQKHPLIGEEIVKGIEAWAGILPLIRHHHERYDGMGYPDGLKGEEIPLEARILAVADSLEAMGSERPYRPPFKWEEIIATLKEGAGSQWDPRVVEAALKMLEKTS
ncbi:MAG: HD domain-containing phosphohydrolase [Anaerolineae bacterium]